MYQELVDRVKQDISRASHLSFTSDVWSAKHSKTSLISLTAHFLDDRLEPHFVVLGVMPVKGEHTSVNLKVLGRFTNCYAYYWV